LLLPPVIFYGDEDFFSFVCKMVRDLRSVALSGMTCWTRESINKKGLSMSCSIGLRVVLGSLRYVQSSSSVFDSL
jgi:hypothetical protein